MLKNLFTPTAEEVQHAKKRLAQSLVTTPPLGFLACTMANPEYTKKLIRKTNEEHEVAKAITNIFNNPEASRLEKFAATWANRANMRINTEVQKPK